MIRTSVFLDYNYYADFSAEFDPTSLNLDNSIVWKVPTYSLLDVNAVFKFKISSWVNAYHVTEADYISVQRGRYKNFEGIDDTVLPLYFNKFLTASTINPQIGAVQYVSYNYRAGSTNQQRIITMAYDGSAWVAVKQDITKPATLTFANKNGVWEKDNTIKMTLVEADYLWIADDANGIGTTQNRANLKSYKNFYQQNASRTTYWPQEQILEELAGRLQVLYPNAEAGQKIQVTYIVYRGSNLAVQTTFIKNAAGNYEVCKG